MAGWPAECARLLVLMGAAPLIVLIVALNLANLLLARASGRRPEMGVRAALGASRERIIGQMLAESLCFRLSVGPPGSPRPSPVCGRCFSPFPEVFRD